MQPLARIRGFTLVELFVVFSIVLRLGGFALHGVTRQSQNHYMDGLQGAFMTLLLNARNAAVINQVAVIVCPVRTQRQDMSDQLRCGKRNNWHRGVMAFTDRNGNRILDAEDKMVAEPPGFAHATIRWRQLTRKIPCVLPPVMRLNVSIVQFVMRPVMLWLQTRIIWAQLH